MPLQILWMWTQILVRWHHRIHFLAKYARHIVIQLTRLEYFEIVAK